VFATPSQDCNATITLMRPWRRMAADGPINTTREFRQTQVRSYDAGLSHDPRDSIPGRFYLWSGEKLERIARSRHDPQAQSFRPSVSDETELCCLGGTAGAGEYLEYHKLWRQNGRLQPDLWLCSPGRSHEKVSSPVKWQAELCLSGL
jgi:hypothetical protein